MRHPGGGLEGVETHLHLSICSFGGRFFFALACGAPRCWPILHLPNCLHSVRDYGP